MKTSALTFTLTLVCHLQNLYLHKAHRFYCYFFNQAVALLRLKHNGVIPLIHQAQVRTTRVDIVRCRRTCDTGLCSGSIDLAPRGCLADCPGLYRR